MGSHGHKPKSQEGPGDTELWWHDSESGMMLTQHDDFSRHVDFMHDASHSLILYLPAFWDMGMGYSSFSMKRQTHLWQRRPGFGLLLLTSSRRRGS